MIASKKGNRPTDFRVGFPIQRRGVREMVVGKDQLLRIHVHRRESALLQGGREDRARQALSDAGHPVAQLGRESPFSFAQFQHAYVQIAEYLPDVLVNRFEVLSAEEIFGETEMVGPELFL